MNQERLSRFARLALEFGLGVRRDTPGDVLFILGELEHGPLAQIISEQARDLGIDRLSLHLSDPLEEAAAIRAGDPLSIMRIVKPRLDVREQIASTPGALLLGLRSLAYPDLAPALMKSHPSGFKAFSAMDSAVAGWQMQNVIGPNKIPWCLVGPPTARWAKKVYPDLDEDAAIAALWADIEDYTWCNQPDPLAANRAWDAVTHQRRRVLDSMQLRSLRYSSPNGTEITFGLHELHQWAGGSRPTQSGRVYEPNVPSKEVFTTPDRRNAHGRFVAGMPFRLKNGALITGLVMEVRDGEVVDVDAESGKQEFIDWIDQDKGKTPGMGGRFFGEVALVGDDSSIGRKGKFHEHTLYDENSCPHGAVGAGYRDPIKGGPQMSAEEAAAVGINVSVIHTDIMLGNNVSVEGTNAVGEIIPLLDQGRWVGDLRIEMKV